MEGHVYTIFRLALFGGLIRFLSQNGPSTIDQCVAAAKVTIKSGARVKHPRNRIRDLSAFAQDLGLVAVDAERLSLTPHGFRYNELSRDPWEVTPQQAELLRRLIFRRPEANRTIYAICVMLALVGLLSDQQGALEHTFVRVIGKSTQWNDVTRQEKSRFTLQYLQELGCVAADDHGMALTPIGSIEADRLAALVVGQDQLGLDRTMERTHTILQAVDVALQQLGRPSHVDEIHRLIAEQGLYEFGAKDTAGVVGRKIREQTEENPDCLTPRYVKTKPNTFCLVAQVKVGQLVAPRVKYAASKVQEVELERAISAHSDEEFEAWLRNVDGAGDIQVKTGLVRMRKLDRSIIDQLKAKYGGSCQLCGWSARDEYGVDVSEGHHIDHFSRSLDNRPSNIAILCPSHHTLVHAADGTFDRTTKEFVLVTGHRLRLAVNAHL